MIEAVADGAKTKGPINEVLTAGVRGLAALIADPAGILPVEMRGESRVGSIPAFADHA